MVMSVFDEVKKQAGCARNEIRWKQDIKRKSSKQGGRRERDNFHAGVFRWKDEADGEEFMEFHVDFSGEQHDAKYDAFCNALGVEGGPCSAGFDGRSSACAR